MECSRGTSGWSSRSLSSSCSSPSDTVLEPLQYLLGLLSGSLVGLLLGLVGGGGSILAVPLMVYLVGVSSTHVAKIGRASGRERVCQYVYISVWAVSLK